MILGVILFACNTAVLEKANPEIKYKMDMIIEYEGQSYLGTVVLPKKPAYELRFTSPGKMDLFTFSSCSRDIGKESASFLGSPKRAVIHYMPNEIEKQGACLVELGSFEKIKGRHSWGLIDFQDEQTTLNAKIICGEKQYISQGVSICQQKEGLIQKIIFDTPVLVHPDLDCPLGELVNKVSQGLEFEYTINKGQCIYSFMEKAIPHRLHRLTTYGYQKILLRED